jgi:hypothetical protein
VSDLGDIPRYVQVPFPLEAGDDTPRTRGRARRRVEDPRPVQVYPQLIEGLGIEEVVTYMRLALWHQRGEESSIERLAEELWFGSADHAERWVHALVQRDLVVTDDAYRAALKAEWDAHTAETKRSQDERQDRLDNADYLDGYWHGEWPAQPKAVPPKGISVVYFQYDKDGQLAYIGSTKQFLRRMEGHLDTSRPDVWARWEARECAARDEAYVIEDREIRERRPYQNKPGVVPVAKFRTSRRAGA